jgi:hypothetical protein
VSGTQPVEPIALNCWDVFVFDSQSCVWVNLGSQPEQPSAVNCWDEFVFDDITCVWNNVGSGTVFYIDSDGDGFGNASATVLACSQPVGYASNNADCDDTNAAVNPSQTEECGNSIDDNCSGEVNENCCPILPSAFATVINAQCAALNNGAIQLTVNSGAAPFSFVWSNGSNTEDISNLFIGAYSVTITDSNGCQGTASFTVGNSNQATATPIAIDGPYGVCRSSSGNVFSTPAVPGATSYQWTLPSGATGSSTTNSITLSFSSTYNTGNLSVRAIGPCGTSAAFTRSVIVFTSVPSPPASISGPTTGVCAGSTQTYSCTAVAAAATYLWTAPTNATIISGQGTQNVTVSFASNFGASGLLSVRSVNCLGQSTARSINVYSTPVTPGAISGVAINVCSGLVLNYAIAEVPGATSYVWTVPANTTISSGQGTNVISLTIGASFTGGQIAVRAVSSCGQSQPRTFSISRNPAAPAAISGQLSNLCGGGQYTYSVAAVSGATSYQWTVPTGCTIVTNNGNSIVMSVPSTFTTGTLSVRAYNSCGGSSLRSASLTRLPSTPASITGVASVCPNQVGVTFTTPAVTGVTQLWTTPTGATITAGQSTTSMTCTWGTAAGSVTVRSVNACGQSAAFSKSITLLACMEEEGGAPEESRTSDLNVYPNPNTGQFTIRASTAGNYELLNGIGQLLESFTLGGTQPMSKDVQGLSNGVYFIRNAGDGFVQRVVVAK